MCFRTKVGIFFCYFFLLKDLSAASIFLENDSSFVLTAIVQSNSGILLAQETLEPAKNSSLSERKATKLRLPDASNRSLTPYIVIWKCVSGSHFSICRNVSPGDFVKATRCQGSYDCVRKKEKKSRKKAREAR